MGAGISRLRPLDLPMTSATHDLQNAATVREIFLAGARANRGAACRAGSVDRIGPPGTLIATGDIHDNPLHFARLVEVAGMGEEQARRHAGTQARSEDVSSPASVPPCLRASVSSHLVLHEIIHSDRLINGMDFSYRAL